LVEFVVNESNTYSTEKQLRIVEIQEKIGQLKDLLKLEHR